LHFGVSGALFMQRNLVFEFGTPQTQARGHPSLKPEQGQQLRKVEHLSFSVIKVGEHFSAQLRGFEMGKDNG
jgi:hypothetical protein